MEPRKLLCVAIALLSILFLSSCNPYSLVSIGAGLVGSVGSSSDKSSQAKPADDAAAALIAKDSDRITEMWTGEVDQPGYGSYPAEMRLTKIIKGSECGSIIYPTLGCGATVTCIDIQGNKYVFREQIKYGPCVHGGTIQAVKTDAGVLSWEWFYPGGKSGAVGTLYLSD